MNDPVFEEGDLWYFWNETWSDKLGSYPDEATARKKLDEYIKLFLEGEDE